MDYSNTNDCVRFRNVLYHDIAKHFNITRDTAQRFANAARRVFSRLRCNKVDAAPANARVIQVQGLPYDGEIEYDHCRFCTETHACRTKVKANQRKVKVNVNQTMIRTNMATVTGIGNVTVIKVLPTGLSGEGENGVSGAPIIRRMKRAIGPITLFGKTWGKKSGGEDEWKPNNNLLIECLDYDRFWTTTKDADLIM